MRKNVAAILALTVACATRAASAEETAIVAFGFAGASAGKAGSLAVERHDPGLAVTPLTAVGTHGALDYARTLMYSSWPTAGSGLDRTQYYEFTVEPLDGRAVAYGTLTLSVASGGKGTARVEIRASTDGFRENDVLLDAFTYPANTTVQTAEGLDLSALGRESRPVTFRISMEKGDSGFAGLAHTDAFGGGTSVIVTGEVLAKGP